MSYKIQNFEDGKVLTAGQLINIESAIIDVEDKISSINTNSNVNTSFKQIAKPINVSELAGKRIVCIGDSITQGTTLGDPSAEKPTDSNGQIYPAITNEELAASIPVGVRGRSYPYYLTKLGVNLTVDNFGTSGWCLPTGYTLQSKLNGYDGDTPTNTVNIHTLKTQKFPTEDPYAITVMFGVNEFTRHYPLGEESSLYKNYVENKLDTYDLTYIRWKKDFTYVDGDNNVVATYNASTDTYDGICESYIDDNNKKIYVLTDTIYGAWEYTALRLKKDFKNSKIIFMTPYLFRGIVKNSGHNNFINVPNKEGYYFSDMMDVIISTGLKYKIPVLDNFYNGGVTLENAWKYIGDSCHLNYRGAISIAQNILEFLTINPVVLNPKWLQPGGASQNNNDGSIEDDGNSVPVTGLELNTYSVNLLVGETYKLTHTIIPDNATNKTVTWASSNESVATVVNGVITAKSKGDAVITCLTDDNGVNKTCDVFVEENNLVTTEKTLDEIKTSLKRYNAESSDSTEVNTITNPNVSVDTDSITYGGDNKDSCLFSDLPLYAGSEIEVSIVEGTNSNPNFCIGFDSDIEGDWKLKNWKTDNTGVIIPESHVWIATKIANVAFLERQTGKFKDTSPALPISTIMGEDNKFTLKVLKRGFEIYKNGECIYTMINTSGISNPYLTHTYVPVYFCFSTSTNVSLKIHKFTQVSNN